MEFKPFRRAANVHVRIVGLGSELHHRNVLTAGIVYGGVKTDLRRLVFLPGLQSCKANVLGNRLLSLRRNNSPNSGRDSQKESSQRAPPCEGGTPLPR